ncbi:hypothetical protein QCA50_003228 [Cerrena zonata]|uniref:Dol-P-Man:Man(5)GlcNAc(2)-PP-Dol alpha-1,3-mannosyltransferase n=1 Tax=Cerrena zonata TaxID=2478898 RepID=A0AAW0GP96_9APHY
MSSPQPLRLVSIRSPQDVFSYIRLLLTDARYFTTLATLVILGDAFLTQLIIRFVSYTEIDWETYMYQVELYIKGERDYAAIEGPTGPLVYPAGHVYVHHLLYTLTQGGLRVALAQQIYGLLYIVSLALTCLLYSQAGGIPNWILLLLPLSKRLHSIFALRLFNDCWALVAVQAATLAYSLEWDIVGTLFYGSALSIKMSVLLYLPGILVVLFKRKGLLSTLGNTLLLLSTQVAAGAPFLLSQPWSYLHYSYEFSRQFLYKWTVNWRFVSEETFLSSNWARGLLLGHLGTLVGFGLFKWCRKDGGTFAVLKRGLKLPTASPSSVPVTADYVVTVLWTGKPRRNIIRSFSALPILFVVCSPIAIPCVATKYPVPVKIVLLLVVEYAWNVFPSTPISSGLLCCRMLC